MSLHATGAVEHGPVALRDFAGIWRLDRRIDDKFDHNVLKFDGIASLRAKGSDLVYLEEGHMRLPNGTALPGTRRYVWRGDAEGVGVYFDDGRFFHRFPFVGGAGIRHDCGPDLYIGDYDLSDWPEWRVRWTVTGPRKDYVSESRYWPSGT